MTLQEELEPLNENTITFIASHLLEEIESRAARKPLNVSPEEQFRAEASYLQSVTGNSEKADNVILSKKEAAIELLTRFAEASPDFEASLREALAEREKAGKQLFDPVTGLSFVMVAIAFAILRPNLEYQHDHTKENKHTKFTFTIRGAEQLDKVIEAVGKLIPSILPFASGKTANSDRGNDAST